VSKRCVVACPGALSFPSVAFAGARMLPQWEGQAIITTTTSASDNVFGFGPTPRYDETELQG
jgi:hypothetical protein